jgi:hypothetical protein
MPPTERTKEPEAEPPPPPPPPALACSEPPLSPLVDAVLVPLVLAREAVEAEVVVDELLVLVLAKVPEIE